MMAKKESLALLERIIRYMQESKTEFLTTKELKRLVFAIDGYLSFNKVSFDEVRDAFIVKLLVYSGIKTSELIKLKEDDFILKANKVTLVVDEVKRREITIPSIRIATLYKNYRAEKKTNTRFLLCKSPLCEKQIDGEDVSRAVSFYYKKARVDKKGGASSIRNGFALHLFENGLELQDIQEILGHLNLRTTKDLIKKISKKKKLVDVETALSKI